MSTSTNNKTQEGYTVRRFDKRNKTWGPPRVWLVANIESLIYVIKRNFKDREHHIYHVGNYLMVDVREATKIPPQFNGIQPPVQFMESVILRLEEFFIEDNEEYPDDGL